MQSALRRGRSGRAFASHPVHGEQHPCAQLIAFIAWRKLPGLRVDLALRVVMNSWIVGLHCNWEADFCPIGEQDRAAVTAW